jgi:hypothetical protein
MSLQEPQVPASNARDHIERAITRPMTSRIHLLKHDKLDIQDGICREMGVLWTEPLPCGFLVFQTRNAIIAVIAIVKEPWQAHFPKVNDIVGCSCPALMLIFVLHACKSAVGWWCFRPQPPELNRSTHIVHSIAEVLVVSKASTGILRTVLVLCGFQAGK